MNKGVKAEPQDEAEIRELSAKMVEANRVRMLAQAAQTARNANSTPAVAPVPGQSLNLLNYFTRSNSNKTKPPPQPASPKSNLGDEESIRGRFGWTTLGKNHIPYITRTGEKYCAVRMVEMKVLNKYLTVLHQDIYSCTCIRSYYITEAECRLLNEINVKHCDLQFGRDEFTLRDLIVRLNDAVEFYNFLDSCYNKLINGNSSPLDRCGFIRINKESVVPYTVYNTNKYVPLFYFEGETENLKLKAEKLEGWDLSYLKFCCKVQGIRNELFAHDSCAVIGVTDIKNYFPPGTLFEDYWPSKVVDSPLLTNGKVQTQMGQWTRQPTAAISSSTHPTIPAVAKPAPPLTPKTSTPAPAIVQTPPTLPQTPPQSNSQLQGVQTMFRAYGLNTGAIRYPVVPSRPAAARTYASSDAPTTSQVRPSYYVAMSQSHPPPLIRAGQSTAYTNNHQSVNYMMMNEQNATDGNTYRQAPQLLKYPPPLTPVRHINGGVRYEVDQDQYGSSDAVDLSVNNSATSSHPPPLINQQPAHQQSLSHPAQHPPVTRSQTQEERSPISNGCLPHQNNTHTNLINIDETPQTPPANGPHVPYKIQKALIDNRMIACINMKPYVYTDLLTTIPHIAEQLFSNVSAQFCQEVLQVLGISMYRGNSRQMQILFEHGKALSPTETMPLVHVRQILNFMPQIKYMLSGLMTVEVESKRRRAS